MTKTADRYTTDLYFEAHVTIDPVEDDEGIDLLKTLAGGHHFRLAEFLYKKSGTVAHPDDFLTTRGKDYYDVLERTLAFVKWADIMGFKVRRFKIENTLMDIRL